MAIILVLSMVLLIGLDQVVKYWAAVSLQPKGNMDFISIGKYDILDLTYVENDGAIFGSMSGQRWFLIGFTSIILLIGIFLLIKFAKRSKCLSIALALFISGGIGNLIDRIRLGYVIDMFDIQLFKFAVFNVADICVVFSEILLFIYILFIEPKAKKKKELLKTEANTNE